MGFVEIHGIQELLMTGLIIVTIYNPPAALFKIPPPSVGCVPNHKWYPLWREQMGNTEDSCTTIMASLKHIWGYQKLEARLWQSCIADLGVLGSLLECL